MRTDATFRYGGALVMALVIGLGLGFAVSPGAGVTAGLIAGLVWLAVGVLGQRRSART
ncbi:hypothetical protein [Pseudokineococcus sp. 1T1Z-3]|uniref:hypothetical protein n=1 Tax=Pseudokineococcus sp. 1T1Z-3 TaxID=3132745 RepID=UPI0030ADC527